MKIFDLKNLIERPGIHSFKSVNNEIVHITDLKVLKIEMDHPQILFYKI